MENSPFPVTKSFEKYCNHIAIGKLNTLSINLMNIKISLKIESETLFPLRIIILHFSLNLSLTLHIPIHYTAMTDE